MYRALPALLAATLVAPVALGGEDADGVFDVFVDVDIDQPLSVDRHEDLLEQAAGRAPASARRVRLWTRNAQGAAVPLESLLPPAGPIPKKADEPTAVTWAATAPVDAPGPTSGALSGKAVYVSQCHGWIYYESLGHFSTQRGNLFDTVEDFHNPEGTNKYLVRYLENAGAAVFTTKERDMTAAMAIADNDTGGYAESSAGFEDGPAGLAPRATWSNGENPFDAGTTRRFPGDGGAVATWTPDVPHDGVFALYVSWDSDSGNNPAAHYRITHPGGVIDRTFDQRVHGGTWQYVETLWMPAGSGGITVELVGDTGSSAWLSADAVRVGGGSSDTYRVGNLSGRPRWEEGANLYAQFNGAPMSVYDPSYSGNGSDVSTRSLWAAWEHPSGEDAIYLSWHSNAGGGTGTATYTYEGSWGSGVTGSTAFSALLQDEIVNAVRAQWDSGWTSRGTKTAAFGEVSPAYNDEMPAALVELAFHDHPDDVVLLKEPRFRMDASRAMTRAIIRYFAQRDGYTPTFPPEPPTHLVVQHDASGQLVASWAASPSGYPLGDAATSYRVYTSRDGHSWDNGTDAIGTSAPLPTAPGEAVYVRVAGVNDGGVSFPSEVLGARRATDGVSPVLVVDAYDRLQGSQLLWEDVGNSVGLVRRLVLPRMNGFDTTLGHAHSIDALGWPFDSASDEAVADLDLSRWDLVIWAAGEESTYDESFDGDQQAAIRTFHDAGGALWVSGSEILWDLDHEGEAADRAFAQDVLGALMAADDSGTTAAHGVDLLAGLTLDFGVVDGAPYDVDYPDVLDSTRTAIALYDGGDVAATLGDNVAMFGMPFESIGSESARDEVTARLLTELVPGFVPGAGDDDDDDDDTSGDDDDDDDDDDDTVGDDDDAVGDDDDDATPLPPGPVLPRALRNEVDDGDGCDDGCQDQGASTALLPLLLVAPLRRRRSVQAP